MEIVEIKKKSQEGQTFYQLTGPSFEAVQAEVERIMETVKTGLGTFTLPRKVVGKYMAHGIIPIPFKVGQRVMLHGYQGTVVKVCEGQLSGMLEVRLPGGVVCVGMSEIGK